MRFGIQYNTQNRPKINTYKTKRALINWQKKEEKKDSEKYPPPKIIKRQFRKELIQIATLFKLIMVGKCTFMLQWDITLLPLYAKMFLNWKDQMTTNGVKTRGCSEKGTLLYCDRNVNCHSLLETIWQCLLKCNKYHIPFSPPISLLGIHPINIKLLVQRTCLQEYLL